MCRHTVHFNVLFYYFFLIQSSVLSNYQVTSTKYGFQTTDGAPEQFVP